MPPWKPIAMQQRRWLVQSKLLRVQTLPGSGLVQLLPNLPSREQKEALLLLRARQRAARLLGLSRSRGLMLQLLSQSHPHLDEVEPLP